LASISGILREYQLHNLSYVVEFLLEWEMFPTAAVHKIKTHSLGTGAFLNRSVYQIMWKTVQAPNEKMAHAHSILETQGYK
jgi:hypothetical protein